DVAIRTALSAGAAANAPVFNNDLQRISAADRSYRAADHTERIATLPARGGNKKIIEAKTVADKAGYAIVRVGAGLYAEIAARAAIEIEHQQALGIHQPLRQEL